MKSKDYTENTLQNRNEKLRPHI